MIFFAHGWEKLAKFGTKSSYFPDPLGLGSPSLSLALIVFAEVFCALAVIFGALTRMAAFVLVVAMLVAAFVFHADDPFADRELALTYLSAFLAIMFCGAGQFSVDEYLWPRFRP
jgi:putative oxidoreductase